MATINISKNTSVQLRNIGSVQRSDAGDRSSQYKGLAQLGKSIGDIAKPGQTIAMVIKKRQDEAAVNSAMADLMIGAGKISDDILGDDSIRPGDYQGEFKSKYNELYGEVTKNLTAYQMEKMSLASNRLFASSMISLGHTAMNRSIAEEKASSARLSAAAKARAIDNPTEENINFYLGAFTDAQKDIVQEIRRLENEDVANKYGKRNDGTIKGEGWKGELQLKGGGIATEYSVGVNINGKEVEIPTIVPTLTQQEVEQLTNDIIPNNKEIPKPILDKAVAHAKKRISEGKSPFYGNSDKAAALREALRVRQTQGINEILGESATNEIKAAEDAGDEAALEALAKKDWRKSAYGIDPTDGKEKILSSYDQMLGREGFGDNAAHALKSQAETALRRVRSAKEKAQYDTRVANEKRYYDELAEERMNVIDPERIGNSSITVSAYRKKLDADTTLDPQSKKQMLAEAASIEKYRTDYWDAIKKHQEEVKDKLDKHKSQYGFFVKDGKNADGSDKYTFYPAKAFPKNTDQYAANRFADESSIWNDPNHARIELKAAVVTGSVSEEFYRNRLKHADTMSDERSRQAWEKIFPTINDLVKSGYGKKELSPEEKNFRKKNSIPEAIWAKRGIAGSPVDWVSDSLEYNGGEDYDNGTEEFIPLETMSQIEDTVQRLARNGVDPTEAIRQIVAPTIEMGFRRDLVERLKDEQFFNAVVERFNLENNTAAKMKAATSHYLKNRTEKSFVSDKDTKSKEN